MSSESERGRVVAAHLLALVGARRRRGGQWVRVLTWKRPHVDADRAALSGEVRTAVLVREPSNAVDSCAVQVSVDGRPIGYVDAWQAAHLQDALLLLDVAPEVALRRSRRKTSPLHEVYLPELHPASASWSECEICEAMDGGSAHPVPMRSGSVWMVRTAPVPELDEELSRIRS